MEPGDVEVCPRYIPKYSTREGSNIFQLFDTKEKKDHFVASRRRFLQHQGETVALQEGWHNEWHDIGYQGTMAKAPPCPERTLKRPLSQQRSSSSTRDEESQWVSVEDRRRWRVAFEETGKRRLRYQKTVRISKWASLNCKNSIRQIAQQAMNENGQKIFEIFRQGEEDVCIASLARWNAQLKGLAELEKGCQNMAQEVKLFK